MLLLNLDFFGVSIAHTYTLKTFLVGITSKAPILLDLSFCILSNERVEFIIIFTKSHNGMQTLAELTAKVNTMNAFLSNLISSLIFEQMLHCQFRQSGCGNLTYLNLTYTLLSYVRIQIDILKNYSNFLRR